MEHCSLMGVIQASYSGFKSWPRDQLP